MLAIGLMSGTSLDGVDACLVDIKKGKKSKFNIVHFTYVPYDKELKNKILNVASNKQQNPLMRKSKCSLFLMVTSFPFIMGYFSESITAGYEDVKSYDATSFCTFPTINGFACVKPPANARFNCLYSFTL